MNRPILSRESEEFLDDLADELSVPDNRYEQAERSYKSLGEWLQRKASSVGKYDPEVYVQGSFRLGTTIRPISEAEDYDIDSVCEFRKLGKAQLSQEQLKNLLGVEIEAYQRAHNMTKPLRPGRRCWILDYADGAQFHMDVVPALPNSPSARALLETKSMDVPWVSTAIAITDKKHPAYTRITNDWPRSNPKGYSEWFRSRMAAVLERRKRALAKGVERIPDYKVRTPLQAAVMLLKRHRDYSFQRRPEVAPISVIITTLAAHSYGGEETIGQALASVLSGMDQHILSHAGRLWIPNPSDPAENFADKWADHPERATAFVEWLEQVRREFWQAVRATDRNAIAKALESGLGTALTMRAESRRPRGSRPTTLKAASMAPQSAGLTFPDRRLVPTKPQGFGRGE